MTEIEFLMNKARENLEVAKMLHSQSHSDIAASRAYYAMFYIAQALLLTKGLSFSSHSAVIAAYGKEFAKTKELPPQFHQYLILSQSERNLGDYGVGVTVPAADVIKVLGWADEFLEAAERYLQTIQ